MAQTKLGRETIDQTWYKIREEVELINPLQEETMPGPDEQEYDRVPGDSLSDFEELVDSQIEDGEENSDESGPDESGEE